MAVTVLLKTASLRKNLKNIQTYGDEPNPEFVERVRKYGVRTPLLIANDRVTIIGGQCRWQAAMIIGIDEVPCTITDIPPDPESIEFGSAALIDNYGREKTVDVLAREGEWWDEIYAKEAAIRSASNLKKGEVIPDVPNLAHREKSDETATGKSLAKAAAKVGMKRSTLAKAIKVVKKIDELAAAGDTGKAAELRDTLNNKSVSAALQKAEETEQKKPRFPLRSFFDDAVFERVMFQQIRLCVARAKHLDCVRCSEQMAVQEAIELAMDRFREWQNSMPV